MRFKMTLAAVAAAALAFVPAIPAQSADADFNLHNESSGIIVSFYLEDSGGWSDDWLDEVVMPGEVMGMVFDYDGECELGTRVEFADGTYLDALVDYCETDNVYVEEDEITVD